MNAVSAALLAMLIAASASAQEKLNLSYRGVGLGDTLERAHAEASKHFEIVRLDNRDETSQVIRAGDKAGMREVDCPYVADRSRRLDCLSVMYVLNPIEGKLQVSYINVTQSFKQGLPMEDFMFRTKDSYGTPRVQVLNGKDSSHAYVDKDQMLLWGGKKTLSTEAFMFGVPYADSQRVGGKNILMRVLSTSDGVIGYELRISDFELFQKREEERTAEREARNVGAAEAARKDSINKLKF